jgi:DNA-binding transcriptional regulator YbjK
LVARFGTKIIVTLGLVLVAAGLLTFSLATTTSGYPLVALVLVIIGMGMGLAMAPATDSIMGSLPPAKAGVGSAMNDTTREIGGALGVAILGSITAAVYSSRIVADPDFAALQAASPEAAAAVKDSVGAAAAVAAQLPEAAGKLIVAGANEAFVHAMGRTVIVGAVVALLGALVAFVFLPARARGGADAVGSLVDGAARRLPDDPERRLGLARATLGLLADAGMSSLTYNAVAARSGIGTATLEHYWGSRVDAVTDALAEVFRAHPVPDTGDLRRDLCDYVSDVGRMLSEPRARQVIGALIAEASSNAELSDALRQRVGEPRRREIAERLGADGSQLTVPIDVAIDLLVGPVYHRVLVVDEGPVDPALVDAVVDAVLARD